MQPEQRTERRLVRSHHRKTDAVFNPRTDVWSDHFEWDGPIIQPLTPEGRVTVKILRLNDPERVAERLAAPP